MLAWKSFYLGPNRTKEEVDKVMNELAALFEKESELADLREREKEAKDNKQNT